MVILLVLFQLRTNTTFQVNEVVHWTEKNQLKAQIILTKQVMSEFRPRNAIHFIRKIFS